MPVQVIKIICFLSCLQLLNAQVSDNFVQAGPEGLSLDGQHYKFTGMNFWQAIPLAMSDSSRLRLLSELDQLDSLGYRNLRILATAQGPSDAPWRICENLQPQPESINERWLQALDFVLDELSKRNMKAVLYLGNFWHWSGGFAQYVAWAEGSEIPYPPPDSCTGAESGDWNQFIRYSARFYKNKKAQNYYQQAVSAILFRKNSLNGRAYRKDPTIMAWELANEPREGKHPQAFYHWLRQSARWLKKQDVRQLVCSGSEGLHTQWQSRWARRRWRRQHRSRHLDYLTVHLWPQNWGWYDPAQPDSAFLDTVMLYLQAHEQIARQLGKPMVIEELGLARDGGAFAPAAPVQWRWLFFERVRQLVQKNPAIAGINYWAWAGSLLPAKAGSYWQAGNAYSGDPPHERQGWYGIYNSERDLRPGTQD